MASHDTGSGAVIHGQAVKSSDWWSASMVDARSSTHQPMNKREEKKKDTGDEQERWGGDEARERWS
ncbi:hypothetical protein Bca52824_092127 [Brassica carinata]|uniref:Uncharacterized protein n=1 Tax=Brassica carinata TaxID=52824 RepID=A0A8X7TEZ5_BRACI|nr:hypothetical protein Bca52824_092127 [Brassica carinata]